MHTPNQPGYILILVIDMKQEVDFIKDRILSEDDKRAIAETLKAEKQEILNPWMKYLVR